MRHFIQLHKTYEYGPFAHERGAEFVICTDKALEAKEAVNGIAWLISCDGRPREYLLECRFKVTRMEDSDHPHLAYEIVGREGRAFAPPITLNGTSVLERLRFLTKNFRSGLTEIDASTAGALEELAH